MGDRKRRTLVMPDTGQSGSYRGVAGTPWGPVSGKSMITRLGLALLIAFALPAEAQSGKAKGSGARGNSAAKVTHARGSDVEIRIVRDYYGVPSRKLKPLPPGIAKNLARGKPIPPGIARTRAPDDLVVLLPAREGTRWWIAGDRALLIDTNNILVDFFLALR